MTPSKILSRGFVNHLLNSILKDHSKCQICVLYRDISTNNCLIQAQSNQSSARVSASKGAVDKLGSAFGLYSRSNRNNTILQKRLASSATQSVVASLKRDASTQAQQQIVEQPEPRKYITDSFRSSELEIVSCLPNEMKPKPSVDNLIFGHAFTDHMFRVDWDNENGWTTPLISKLNNIDLHPAAKVFHYALEAFEGAKAFRGHDNKIRFFRLDQNIKRLLHSARRLALPEFDELELAKCIHRLVALDQDWIPQSKNQQQLTSLYVRPTILGVEPSLGVASSKKAILYVLLSPVGPYFKTGFKPVSLYADPDFVRAWHGGAGNSKLGSNYAPTIKVQKDAEKHGLQQVLWLFGEDAKLTEVGTMNIFVTVKNQQTGKIHLITPPLTDGLILPGITRDSILQLARQWSDVVCEERYVTISEIMQLIHENKLIEMFGSGTACIVCPISSIHMKDGTRIAIPHSDVTQITDPSAPSDKSTLTKRILNAITDIQYGKVQHPWSVELDY